VGTADADRSASSHEPYDSGSGIWLSLSKFAMDNLPQTHDGTDRHGEMLAP